MVEAALADKIAFSPAEAAAVSGLGINLIRSLCHRDASFPAFSSGKNILIPRREFIDWLKQQCELRVGMPEKILKRRGGRK